MRKLAVFAVAATLAGVAVAAAPARRHHSDNVTSMLALRLRSIELQIDILRDRRLIGGAEAQDLQEQARRLEQRLGRLPERQAGEVEAAVDRLQQQLRFAAEDARLGDYAARRRDLGRFDDGERYRPDGDSHYDRDSYRRPDPRGDPFLIWEERDERGPH